MRVLIIGTLLLQIASVKAADESPVFIEPDAVSLTMSQFDLTEAEAIRAERLRLLDTSFGDANLSAVELLGKYADTEVARLRYARKHVIAAADNVGRSQAWALAIYRVSQEQDMVSAILATNPEIREGLARLNMTAPGDDWSGFDRGGSPLFTGTRTLFVGLDCGEPCLDAFHAENAKRRMGQFAALNLVFVGTTSLDETRVFNWAKKADVSYESLEAGALNLHIDDSDWQQMRNHSNDVPLVVR